jgi:hypothetical protein
MNRSNLLKKKSKSQNLMDLLLLFKDDDNFTKT